MLLAFSDDKTLDNFFAVISLEIVICSYMRVNLYFHLLERRHVWNKSYNTTLM